MQTVQFIADSAATALARIQEELGPDAVVLNVRPLPAPGVARLWQRNQRVEIIAGLPDQNPTFEPGLTRGQMPLEPVAYPDAAMPAPSAGCWQSVAWLEAMGLLPAHAKRLQAQLRDAHGAAPPASLEAEWDLVNAALSSRWRPAPPIEEGTATRPHVFIGPPGSGKTTVLCKWLTLAVLTEERLANVWRLDGSSANTAEFLTVHCEMLGAPIERFWSAPQAQTDLLFVDLPGIDGTDAAAAATLRKQLATLPSPRIHLVLNAAYETSVLLEQWQAFSVLQPEDLIFTHLDEELRRFKLWNFVLGTNCSLRFLSAGQKIPGDFQKALPGLLFPIRKRL